MPAKRSNGLDELRRLNQHKSRQMPAGHPLGVELIDFFRQSVARRQTKLVKLAEAWTDLVPALLSEHCALEGFSKGTLTVLVDSSSHLYDLKQLLLAGLQDQLLLACKSTGLRKIALRPGRWYAGADAADRAVRFHDER
jgi:hypothetical protein